MTRLINEIVFCSLSLRLTQSSFANCFKLFKFLIILLILGFDFRDILLFHTTVNLFGQIEPDHRQFAKSLKITSHRTEKAS